MMDGREGYAQDRNGPMRQLALVIGAVGCCAATSSSLPLSALAGRYSRTYTIPQTGIGGAVIGKPDHIDDVVEIVPVSDNSAYFRADFISGDEGTCSISGIGQVKGSAIVYHDPRKPNAGDVACTMTIEHVGKSLRVIDGSKWEELQASCAHLYCGGSGDLQRDMPWSSKRPISYMERLKASQEYQGAMSEWRTGKPKPSVP